jgi:predicted metal-dependent enzyme (double-stranded beta helix superfamily)
MTMDIRFEQFLDRCRELVDRDAAPSACVEAIAPLMHGLLPSAAAQLTPAHRRGDPEHYARNAILIGEHLSLYALVWQPGQWTPVHDHGSWGVVGVIEGALHERAWLRTSPDDGRDRGISLVPGGVLVLDPGSVTSFVPNPDHIHVTGVPAEARPVLTLHLYGRNMNSFHVYDIDAGTRSRINVAHNES